jgi:hypothetical protein
MRPVRLLRISCALALALLPVAINPSAANALVPGHFVIRDAIDATAQYSMRAPIPLLLAGTATSATKTVLLQWRKGGGSSTIKVDHLMAFADGASVAVTPLGRGTAAGFVLSDGQSVYVQITASQLSRTPVTGALVATVGNDQATLAQVNVSDESPLRDLTVANAADGTISVSTSDAKTNIALQLRNGGAGTFTGLVPSGRLVGPNGTSVSLSFSPSTVNLAPGQTQLVTASTRVAQVGSFTGFVDLNEPASAEPGLRPFTVAVKVERTSAALAADATVVASARATCAMCGDATATVVVRLTETGGQAHRISVAQMPLVTRLDSAGKDDRTVPEAEAHATAAVLPLKGQLNLPVTISGLPGPGLYNVKLDLRDAQGHTVQVEANASVNRSWFIAAGLIALGVLVNVIIAFLASWLLTRTRRKGQIAEALHRLDSTAFPPAAPATTKAFDDLRKQASDLKRKLSDSDASEKIASYDRKTRLAVAWGGLNDRAAALGGSYPDLDAVHTAITSDELLDEDGSKALLDGLATAEKAIRTGEWRRIVDALASAEKYTFAAAPDDVFGQDVHDALTAAQQFSDPDLAQDKRDAAFRAWREAMAGDLETLAAWTVPWAPADADGYRGATIAARTYANALRAEQPTTDAAKVADEYSRHVAALLAQLAATPADADTALKQELQSARDQIGQEKYRAARGTISAAAASQGAPDRRTLGFTVDSEPKQVGALMPGAPTVAPLARALDYGQAVASVNRTVLWIHVAVGAVAVVVAVIVGMQTLYQPNPGWGSGWDMISAAIWGLALSTVQYTGVGALSKRLLTAE